VVPQLKEDFSDLGRSRNQAPKNIIDQANLGIIFRDELAKII
jgi:hypothetical protein